MLVLYETALGYCLFKLSDSVNYQDDGISKEFETPEGANKILKLKALHQFGSTATAVEDMTALNEGKLGPGLKKFLIEEIQDKKGKGKSKESLLVVDKDLKKSISSALQIKVKATKAAEQHLWRGIRSQLSALLGGVEEKDLNTMRLGLSHSLSRFKIKFSPDKIDTMVVQAIALLDDLDKEINIYAMRVKEWYGWHFPEMAKIITDNLAYAKVVRAMGFRTNCATTSLAHILPEDLEALLRTTAQISMGTEISESDITHIYSLCDQVISITQYRQQLADYLRNRMNAIAPNLTALVGELVGARLISHAGSLMSLAKHSASTVQILGAEKALFRALKTKHDTPKYGLIYHASLVGQAPPKMKGKMARMTAAKAALSIRYDALADAETKSSEDVETSAGIGIAARAKLESRLRRLQYESEGGVVKRFADRGKKQQVGFSMGGETKVYNDKSDAVDLVPTQRDGASAMDVAMRIVEDVKEEKKKAKDEKKAARKAEKERKREKERQDGKDVMSVDSSPVKVAEAAEKKKRKRESDAMDVDPKEETEEERKARKLAKKAEKAALKAAAAQQPQTNGDSGSPAKKKKKKSKET